MKSLLSLFRNKLILILILILIVIHPAGVVNRAMRITLFNSIARGFNGMHFRENFEEIVHSSVF